MLQHPPAAAELPETVRMQSAGDLQRNGLMVGLAAVMLLVSTTLLVGPAFAVSAARQRRTLALAASNGAHTPVLRRTVLAQALLLGAASALLGVVAGVGLAWLLLHLTPGRDHHRGPAPPSTSATACWRPSPSAPSRPPSSPHSSRPAVSAGSTSSG